MKRSLMSLLEQPDFAVSIKVACLRLGAQDVMERPWNTSTKSHSPPAGRFVLHAGTAEPLRVSPPEAVAYLLELLVTASY
jgi:hypothetical protein